MGTRADFYIGINKNAEWLGSIAWDGYPDGIDDEVLAATTESEFREALAEFVQGRDDWTAPDQGWPWPWNDSCTTDYAYALHEGKVYRSCFGCDWQTNEQAAEFAQLYNAWEENGDGPEPVENGIPVDFPDMSGIKNVSIGGPRDGLIVITGR